MSARAAPTSPGLPYAAFAPAEVFDGATLELFQPGPGEAADHVAIRGSDGERYAMTTTCAANALGYAKPGMHAYGNPDAARAAMAAAGGTARRVGRGGGAADPRARDRQGDARRSSS